MHLPFIYNQFNTTVISLVITSLFQIFSFHNLTCNKSYAAAKWMVKEISEKFWDNNERHKYGLI